jgi:hypothetical protein
MKKLAVLAVALSATIATAAPSQAQMVGYNDRVRIIETYCDRNPRDPDCWGYRDGRWGRDRYNRFYERRSSDLDGIAAGVLGLAVGAIIGGAIVNNSNNNQPNYGDRLVGPVGGGGVNVQACQARYRSYDIATNTFLGYDGVRHPCRL